VRLTFSCSGKLDFNLRALSCPFTLLFLLYVEGRPITKQQFLEPFVVPRFVGFSVATFKAGQTMMPVHEHKSMHEFFYVLEGTGMFQVDDVTHEVSPGTFLHMAPGEKHGIWVPKESTSGDLKVAVCGVTLDDN
jgi:quercetin dioxygenase-like cupin family protein